MKFAILTLLLLSTSALAQQPDYVQLQAQAEKFYAEKSYARAYTLYAQAETTKLNPRDARWVAFRLGDTLWRSEAATNSSDSTKLDQAREKLEAIVNAAKRQEDQDRIWVEAQESVADFWWRQNMQNWGQAWPHYERAFDWWAGQRDSDEVRLRYLQLVWKAVTPSGVEAYYGYYNGNILPLEILDNAVKIARDPKDQARAHYHLATRLRYTGDWEEKQRVPVELEAALRPGKQTGWYDDALYFYGEWMATVGTVTQDDKGEWRQQPDYRKALELFRRLVSEFRKGDSRYYDQAQSQIDQITRSAVGVFASNFFLPDSEIQLNLSWRNVSHVDLNLYKVNLETDLLFSNKDQSTGGWVNQINLRELRPTASWTKTVKDDGTYIPGQETWRMDRRLTPGTYVMEARAGSTAARDVVLVTGGTLVLRTLNKQALAFFCDAITGAPIANGGVKLWEKNYNNAKQEWQWAQHLTNTNQDGIAFFNLDGDQSYSEIFASAQSRDVQAYTLGNSYRYQANEPLWKIYAFTDRPAYRPDETVQWKLIARRQEQSVYSTPANQIVEYEIYDPRGNKVKEDKTTLNSFGSAWGSLALTASMPLGAYRVTFYDQNRQHTIGSANLFRLEEYKLPEFKVAVQTPEIDGHKKAFRLGEKVEVKIAADYYFGGPVSDAAVEVVVYQNPFYHYWYPHHDYSWFYEDMTPRYWYGGGQGQIIKRETVRTDASGKATITFDTPRNAGQDWQYQIEARVTDSSRREIVGSDTVRVTRQRYYVYTRAEHNLYRPNDNVQINVKSLDANDQPISANGQVKITRDYYYEIWLDPNGREVKGDELLRVRGDFASRRIIFPPTPGKDGKGWRLIFRGYQHEDILAQSLKTDSSGDGSLKFTPNREGYYRFAWTSPDKGGPVIQSETTVWVTNDRVTDLGYRFGGVEIVVDKDTFRAGQRAPLMLTTMEPDRYVLFTVEGDDLLSTQLVHVTGNTKLIEMDVEEKHVPNIFLNATMVSDRQLYTDTKQVIVPPVEHFLNVEVKSDRSQYQPHDEGTINITTRDQSGRPVAAEVALGLVDASVFYIQQDTAGDPRQFYFGTKRAIRSQVSSTFQQKAYARLVEGVDKQLIDDRFLAEREKLKDLDEEKRSFSNLSIDGMSRADNAEFKAEFGASSIRALKSAEMRPSGTLQNPVYGANGTPVNLAYTINSPAPKAAPEPGQEPAVQVRNDFRSTVFWRPDVTTDANGVALVKVKYPDSLTTWAATARVVTASDKFGLASAETRTKKPLIVRLEAPRFFVVGDQVTVSAVINNNDDSAMTVTPSLDVEGLQVLRQLNHASPAHEEKAPVTVAANGEQRVDWLVNINKPGSVKLKVTARGRSQADAMEREFTAYEHGIEKLIAKSGKLRADEVAIRLDVPKERKPESTNVMVQIAPSMAVTMLDALPYLIDYPYGCTEQTLSRFLPAVITAKTLKDQGLSPEAAMSRVFGGIEPETARQTHPKGKRDLKELDRITKESLDRLYSMQHGDGGWGWWKDDTSDRFMTAYALWGLTLAREAGVAVKADVLAGAAKFLDDALVQEESNYDMQAWLLHAVALHAKDASRSGTATAGEYQSKAFQNLWNNRERLNAYTRALLALSAHYFGYSEQAQTLIRNLENGVKIDRTPDTSIVQRGVQSSDPSVIGTAHWGSDGIYYRWSDGGVEATSFALRAMLAIDPQNKLIEPVTNWLVKNRRGSQWSNTRDTAIAVLSLNDYLRATGEAASDVRYELTVNGNAVASKHLTAAEALSAPSEFVVDNKYVQDGANEIRIRRTAGKGTLYFSAQARFFSLEEPIKAAGNEIFVRREYYKLVGRQTLLKGLVYDRVPLRDGETVASGDRVEVVVTVEAKNNYEYLLFEDLKPAGLEAVQVRSGESLAARELKSGAVAHKFGAAGEVESDSYTGRSEFVYQELRDRKVALFVTRMPQGVWEIRYSLRAEAPGAFHALPVTGQAMYVPEIKCNDQEMLVKVVDR